MTGTAIDSAHAAALLRYRVMAWVVGTLLVVLVCVGMPLKYFGDSDVLVTWLGRAHGYLYMLLLITVFDLWRRAKFPQAVVLWVALAGTVPFLSFLAERTITARLRDGRY